VLKSNCDTPIDVWLVRGHHQQKQQQQQQQEGEEALLAHPHAALAAVHVKHEADSMAGRTWCSGPSTDLHTYALPNRCMT